MTVWVAVWGMYSSQGVGGVYRTAEAAMKAHATKDARWQHRKNLTGKKDPGWWTNGLDWEEHVSIEPFELED